MSEFKPIHASITDPKNSSFKQFRNDKAECEVVLCNNSENCQLFAEGKCLRIGMFPEACPYGKNMRFEGYTKKAKNYSTWIKLSEERYKDVLNKLKQANKKMVTIDEYVYLPYSHIDMNTTVPFLRHSQFLISGVKLISKSSFNINTILEIVTFSPQAMMGGEITSYQNEVVPLFVRHLSEVYPDLYAELMEKMPSLRIEFKATNFVGRKALLETVNVGSIFTHHKGARYEEKWTWDGTYLTYTGKDLTFSIIEKNEVFIRLTPKENATVIIEDNSQVNKNTKFAD